MPDITDERNRPIAVMVNRSIKGKMPKDATPAQWAAYHAGFKRYETTARGLAVEVYRGYSFCPLYTGRRRQENFERADYLAFDFDAAGLDQVRALTWVDYYASFAYTTQSHTPDNPRCRVVFVLESPLADADEYRQASAAIAWWFARDGLQTDGQCKDLLRLFYGSPQCELWPNWSILPWRSLHEIIAQWRAECPPIPKAPAPPQFHGPASGVEEQKIRDALRYIPAWGDYGDWLRVLMAVHTAMPGSDGVALIEAWSPGKPGEVAAKFRSFSAERPSGVTLGTLFKMAADYGYDAKRASAPAARGGLSAKGVADLRGIL